MYQHAINKIEKWGRKTQKMEYGIHLELRNCTKSKFEWDIEDDLDGIIEADPGHHPKLAA